MQKEPLEGEFRRSDQLCFIGGWEHKMQQEGKKKMKRGQNSYKKSQVDLKQESEKEPWDSQRGGGEKEIGWIQKESWDHNERGGDSTKGARGWRL
ncbi:hypothetical protein TNCT_69821 [Trichonephila clavata]|uniref:Uncharacterized protein n=1 Tax=Trichonephila clavata TaxID=2740835 RepID=A0A8X6KAP5_TRICU|nr:hypothetical protein TNCT_69821 [Trichonephila clavata]